MTDLKALAEEVRNTNLANHDVGLRKLSEALVALIEHLAAPKPAPAVVKPEPAEEPEPKPTPKASAHSKPAARGHR